MIIIDNIELSKNPVITSEAFIIRVSVREEFLSWDDINPNRWEKLKIKTWNTLNSLTWKEPNRWKNFETKTWDAIKRKLF